MNTPKKHPSLEVAPGLRDRLTISGISIPAWRSAIAVLLLATACADEDGVVDQYGAEDVTSGAQRENDAGVNREWASEGEDGESVGDILMSEFSDAEPSGIVFDSQSGSFYVASDDGRLFEITTGGDVQSWEIGGGPEGLALNSEARSLLIADEDSTSLRTWDLEREEFVNNASCELDIVVDGKDGLEAVTFVPLDDALDDWGQDPLGYVIAGTLARANLSVYPLSGCLGGELLEPIDLYGSSMLLTSRDDVSGLHFAPETGELLALHDDGNKLDVLTLNGELLRTYDLPRGKHEGVVLSDVDCGEGFATLTLAGDDGELVEFYDFPVDCASE